MQKTQPDIFYPPTVNAWRKWLENNHLTRQSVWVVFYNKSSGRKTITWSEAVDVALCFGWIDSKKIKIDHETAHQFFSRRKPKGTWSKINKDKIEVLTAQGLMTEAGLAVIEAAKQNGSWTVLDRVESLEVPKDLKAALKGKPAAKAYFEGLSKSMKKAMLQWLVLAKRPETRQKRIDEIVERAGQGLKPRHLTTS